MRLDEDGWREREKRDNETDTAGIGYLYIQGVVAGRGLALRLLNLVARVEIPVINQTLHSMFKEVCQFCQK